jgi:hypothetical protein
VHGLELRELGQTPGAVLDAHPAPPEAPEGGCGERARCGLTHAVPHSSWAATAAARSGSALHTEPDNPKWVALARSTASPDQLEEGTAVEAPHSARSIRAVGVPAAIRAGTAATTLASTRAPTATRITGTTGTVGSGTA